MSSAILHISDLHHGSSASSKIDIEKLRYLFRSIPDASQLTDFIIVLVGDLANKGERAEYEGLNHLLSGVGKMAKEELGVDAFIAAVPGNHDVSHLEQSKDDLVLLYGEDEDTIYFGENDSLKEFRSFCKKAGFSYPETAIETIEISLSALDEKLNLVLVNSAPGSFHGADKGTHHIPEEVFDGIEKIETGITLVAMHHPLDFFRDDEKGRLLEIMHRKNVIHFVAHEHRGTSSVDDNDLGNMLVVRGGEYTPSAWDWGTSKLLLIGNNGLASVFEIKWDQSAFRYILRSEISDFPIKRFTVGVITPNQLAIAPKSDALLVDNENRFIFPEVKDMSAMSTEVKVSARSLGDILNALERVSVIGIAGVPQSGKSTLLYNLFSTSVKRGFSSVYLSSSDCSGSLKRTLQHAVEDQYGGSDGAQRFLNQTNKDNRVLFFDDMDFGVFNGRDGALWKCIFGSFGKVIYTSRHPELYGDFDLELIAGTPQLVLQIAPLVKRKRDEYLKAVCITNDISEAKQDALIRMVDTAVHEHPTGFSLTFGFTSEFVKFALDNPSFSLYGAYTFKNVYESNVRRTIGSRCALDKIKYSKDAWESLLITILSRVASRMYSERSQRTTYGALIEDIRQHFEYVGVTDVEPGKVYKAFIDSGVILIDEKTCDLFFESSGLFAYLIANGIRDKLSRGEGYQEFESLLDSLSFGINELVLLFLSSIWDTDALSRMLACRLKSELENVGEQDSLQMLAWVDTEDFGEIKPASEELKKRNIRLTEEIEQDVAESIKMNFDPFSYSEMDINTPASVAMRIIFVSQFLADYLSCKILVLDSGAKSDVAELLARASAHAASVFITPISSDIESYIAKLKETLVKDDGNQVSDEACKSLLASFCLGIYLAVHSSIAAHFSGQGVSDLFKAAENGVSSSILLRLIGLCNSTDDDAFYSEAKKQFVSAGKDKNRILQFLIQLVVNHYILIHSALLKTNKADRYIGTFFKGALRGGKAKKKLLLDSSVKDNQ